MVMLFLVTWFAFRDKEEVNHDQLYLSDILGVSEHIPTLDEVVETHGMNPSIEDIEAAYGEKVGELYSSRLLPFEAELPGLENSADLQPIKRVYFDQNVRGISPREPEYYLDDEQTFTVNHQVYHINPQQGSLFTNESGFKPLNDWMQMGFVEAAQQTDNLIVVDGLIQVTEDKTVAEVLDYINSIQATLNDQEVGKLLDVVDEAVVIDQAGELFEHEDLYRYREQGDQEAVIIEAHEQFGFVEPELYPYIDSEYGLDDLTIIKDTMLFWRGYVSGTMDFETSATFELNGSSWNLTPYEGESAIPVIETE